MRRRALVMLDNGGTLVAVSRETGVNRSTLRLWARDPEATLAAAASTCWLHGGELVDPAAYAYLLGQYLGDGCLSDVGRVARLLIICADDYPGIEAEVIAAVAMVSGKAAGAVQRQGCREIYAYWMHWPCLFPQHGPGLKHRRAIVLEGWQQEIADAHPQALLRGLIHSDGCRSINRVVVRGTQYSYPRYFFSNESADIRAICAGALDRLGIAWRLNRTNSISIARREAVAALDGFIGPKR